MKAIAFKDGLTPSAQMTASYRMNEDTATATAAPLFSVKPGSRSGTATINLGGAFSIAEGPGSPRNVTVTDSILTTGGGKRLLLLEITP